jgi:predicted nuclease with TOPRIM domain
LANETENLEQSRKVENNTTTQEDYQALKAELEAERQRAQTLVAEATKELTDKVATLEAELATKTGEFETIQGQLTTIQGQLAEATAAHSKLTAAHSELVEEFEGAKAAYAYAVDDYKKLVLASNPLFTPDIIGGDTIEAVKASVDKANALVGKVKEGLEAQAKALAGLAVVPAGAPERKGVDTSSLSTKEKINLGLEQARKRKE